VKEPQEGLSIQHMEDRLVESLILRGAADGRAERHAKRRAWVDATRFAESSAFADRQACGRRPSVSRPAAIDRDIPWRGTKTSEARTVPSTSFDGTVRHGREKTRSFEPGVSGKGTAMVAKVASIVRRDPRPSGGSFGGSSGGRASRGLSSWAERPSNIGSRLLSILRVDEAKNPKSAASRTRSEIVAGETHPSRQNGTGANSQAWKLGAASSSGLDSKPGSIQRTASDAGAIRKR